MPIDCQKVFPQVRLRKDHKVNQHQKAFWVFINKPGIIKNLSKSTFKLNSKEEKDFNLTRLHFTLVFELNLVCCARTYFSFAEIYNKNSKLPLLRYHFKCCRHPCTKAKIPQPVGCDIANPKRSENHLANW